MKTLKIGDTVQVKSTITEKDTTSLNHYFYHNDIGTVININGDSIYIDFSKHKNPIVYLDGKWYIDREYLKKVKQPTKSKKHTWEQISVLAKTDENLCNRDKMIFHYHNENGLIKEYFANIRTIQKIVDESNNTISPDIHFVLGSLNRVYMEELYKLLELKKVPTISMNKWIAGIKEQMEKQKDWITENTRTENNCINSLIIGE